MSSTSSSTRDSIDNFNFALVAAATVGPATSRPPPLHAPAAFDDSILSVIDCMSVTVLKTPVHMLCGSMFEVVSGVLKTTSLEITVLVTRPIDGK